MQISCDSSTLKHFQSMACWYSKFWKFYAEFKYLTIIVVLIACDELRETANSTKSDFIVDL